MLQRSSSCQWFRWLTVRSQRLNHQPIIFLRCGKTTHNSFALALGAVSLFSSRAAATCFQRAPPSLNPKKKRDFSQSKLPLIKILFDYLYLFIYLLTTGELQESLTLIDGGKLMAYRKIAS